MSKIFLKKQAKQPRDSRIELREKDNSKELKAKACHRGAPKKAIEC
ncbi:hypothetical protein [Paraglaciecola sp. L3A3]|nr:hypothetical protein [Paraglaciecola sp. L3A3]